MQLALSLTQKNTKTDASNAKYCIIVNGMAYFCFSFILYAQNKRITMKYSPGCIFTAVVISRWVMHNAERGQFILLLQILQISLKNQPLCKIFANYHQESTTLHKFWKLQWKTNHIVQMWVITMKDPLFCITSANYTKCTSQSVDLKDCEVELRRAHIVKLFSYFQVLLKLASSYWPMLKVCVSWEFVFRWFLYHH